MNQTLIIHAGTYKTGTTALQRFLSENRELLHAEGLYWPKTGAGDGVASWGHQSLALNLNKTGRRDEWHKLLSECARERQVVISSELFSNARQPKKLTPIPRIFEGWTIRVVVYFRRQDRYLESLYNHHIKAVGEYGSIDAFSQKVAHRLDYWTYLKMLGRVFGEDNIVVRVYEADVMQGDICEDFLHTLGIAMPAGARRHSAALNPGLTQCGIELMLQANREFEGDSARLAQIRQDIIRQHAAPPHYKHAFLDPRARQAVLDKYKTGNRRIARRFLTGKKDGKKELFGA